MKILFFISVLLFLFGIGLSYYIESENRLDEQAEQQELSQTKAAQINYDTQR